MKKTPINRETLIDAIVWNCPHYTREGVFSGCCHLDGTQTNCVKAQCSHVFNIFRTMERIRAGEIVVW